MDHSNGLAAGAGIAGMFLLALIVCVIVLIPSVFYLLTLQKALNRCGLDNRAMAPGLVWLMLIPVVNIVWHFFVVINVAKSLGAEFQRRGISEEPEPGKKLGLIMCLLACCGWIPFVNILTGIATLVCWIMYWVKIAGFSGKLVSPVAPGLARA